MLGLGNLAAIITHQGRTMHAGHYKAYLKSSGVWWEMDHGDSFQQMDPFRIQDKEEILLFVFKK